MEPNLILEVYGGQFFSTRNVVDPLATRNSVDPSARTVKINNFFVCSCLFCWTPLNYNPGVAAVADTYAVVACSLQISVSAGVADHVHALVLVLGAEVDLC